MHFEWNILHNFVLWQTPFYFVEKIWINLRLFEDFFLFLFLFLFLFSPVSVSSLRTSSDKLSRKLRNCKKIGKKENIFFLQISRIQSSLNEIKSWKSILDWNLKFNSSEFVYHNFKMTVITMTVIARKTIQYFHA